MGNYPKKDIRDILHKIDEVKIDISGLRKQPDYKNGIVCQNCGSFKNSVINVRAGGLGFKIRRRQCKECGNRWNTAEVITDMGAAREFSEMEVN